MPAAHKGHGARGEGDGGHRGGRDAGRGAAGARQGRSPGARRPHAVCVPDARTTSIRRSRCRRRWNLSRAAALNLSRVAGEVESAKRTRVRVIGPARSLTAPQDKKDGHVQETTKQSGQGDHRRQPAQARLARGTGRTVSALAARRRQPRRRAGRRRPRLGRRAGQVPGWTASPTANSAGGITSGASSRGSTASTRSTSASAPSAAQRYHKEIAAARLVGGPDYRGPIFVDALRATLRDDRQAGQGDAARPDDHRRQPGRYRRRPLRSATGDALRRAAEPGGARSVRGRCRRHPVR